MSRSRYRPATEPTMYFIGVTTSQSSIVKVFPLWARYLGLNGALLIGTDFKQHDDPQRYRDVVAFIKSDKNSLGALVTTHKLDLLEASSDLFDDLDPYALLTREVSSISKRDGDLIGRAKDPLTSGSALEHFLPEGYWLESDGEVLILGAGGSSLALTCYLVEKRHGQNRPRRIVVTNRSPARLDSMRDVHRRLDSGVAFEYILAPDRETNDRVLHSTPAESLVVNATGLGKDEPGSPLTDRGIFPERSFAWDFNYRGDLTFLQQAERQRAKRSLHLEDGWVYFIHGWTQVIADVFHIDIPSTGRTFDDLSRIAADTRRKATPL